MLDKLGMLFSPSAPKGELDYGEDCVLYFTYNISFFNFIGVALLYIITLITCLIHIPFQMILLRVPL